MPPGRDQQGLSTLGGLPATPEWNNNILNDAKSDYFEGEVIPHVYVYKASNQAPLVNGQSISFTITYKLLSAEHERRRL
jgi:hypothetical protein